MRKSIRFVAIALAMVLSSYSMAKDAAAKPLHGEVTSVAKDSITVSSRGKAKGDAPVETTVAIDNNTKFTKDDAAATIADVTAGEGVTLTVDSKTATLAEIHAAKKQPANAK